MSSFRKTLCWIYGLIALAAFAATWSQNLQYFVPALEAAGNGPSYILDLKANGAARSFTVDIGLFLLAATFLMVIEARRLKIGWVWLYVIFGFVIAISVTFPLFLIAREMRLARAGDPGGEVKLTTPDWIGLALTSAAVLGFGAFILS
jgi:hypothetical protein